MIQEKKILEFCKENEKDLINAKSLGIILLDDAELLLKKQESLDVFKSVCKRNRQYGALRILIPEKYVEKKNYFFSKDTLNRARFKTIPLAIEEELMKGIKQGIYNSYLFVFGDESWDSVINDYKNKGVDYEPLKLFIKAWTYGEVKKIKEPVFARGINQDHREYDLQRFSCNDKWQTIRNNHLSNVKRSDCEDYPFLFELIKYRDV